MKLKGWLLAAESRVLVDFAPAPRDLALFRIAYAAILFLNAAPIALWASDAPIAFFNPPIGLPALFEAPPPAGVVVFLNAAFMAALTALLIGWHTSVASLATGAAFLALNTVNYSFGKVNHDILLVLVPLVLAPSGWGRDLSLDARRRAPDAASAPRWPVPLLAVITGYAMFTAGWVKATSGWLDFDRLCTYGHLMQNKIVVGRDPWLAEAALDAALPMAFWKAADLFAVLLELALLPAVLVPRLFRLVLAATTLFHLGVLWLFAIPFSANVLVYALFARWPLTRTAPRAIPYWLAGLIAVSAGIATYEALYLERTTATGIGLKLDAPIVLAGAAVGAFALLRAALQLLRRSRAT